MENNIPAYIEYLETLGSSHSGVKDFAFGGSEKILNRQRSKIKYPIVWAEVPDASFSKAEEDGGIFYGGMVVLATYKKGDEVMQRQREASTFNIMKQIVTRLFEDAKNGNIKLLDDNIKIEPVDPWSADNDIGWRIDFRLGTDMTCFERDVQDGVWTDLT